MPLPCKWHITIHVNADNLKRYQFRELDIETRDETFVITQKRLDLEAQFEEEERLENPQVDILTVRRIFWNQQLSCVCLKGIPPKHKKGSFFI